MKRHRTRVNSISLQFRHASLLRKGNEIRKLTPAVVINDRANSSRACVAYLSRESCSESALLEDLSRALPSFSDLVLITEGVISGLKESIALLSSLLDAAIRR